MSFDSSLALARVRRRLTALGVVWSTVAISRGSSCSAEASATQEESLKDQEEKNGDHRGNR